MHAGVSLACRIVHPAAKSNPPAQPELTWCVANACGNRQQVELFKTQCTQVKWQVSHIEIQQNDPLWWRHSRFDSFHPDNPLSVFNTSNFDPWKSEWSSSNFLIVDRGFHFLLPNEVGLSLNLIPVDTCPLPPCLTWTSQGLGVSVLYTA